MTVTANDNYKIPGLKAIASAVSVVLLTTSILGCSNRNEKLEELISDASNQCATLGVESDLEVSEYSNVKGRLINIEEYWQKTAEGAEWSVHIENIDAAFCFSTSTDASITKVRRGNAYIADKNLSDAAIARSVFTEGILDEYNEVVNWSESYKPVDALLWSRMVGGHEINVEISQSYEMAERSFYDPVWHDIENNSAIEGYAFLFRQNIENGGDVEGAHRAVLESYLSGAEDLAPKDEAFLTWYDEYLHAKDESTLEPCLGFDGNMTICTGWETVPPEETVAASDLNAETLVTLSGVYTASAYLGTEEASNLINNLRYTEIDQSVTVQFETVQDNANKCCGENRLQGDNSVLGFTFSGGMGLTF